MRTSAVVHPKRPRSAKTMRFTDANECTFRIEFHELLGFLCVYKYIGHENNYPATVKYYWIPIEVPQNGGLGMTPWTWFCGKTLYQKPWAKVLSTTAMHTRSTWNQSAAQQWMQVASLHASNHVAYKGWHNLRCTCHKASSCFWFFSGILDWKDFAWNCCLMMAYDALYRFCFMFLGKCTPPPKKSVPSQSMAHHNFPWRSRRRYWHFQLQLVVVHLCHPGHQIAFRIAFLPCLLTPFCIAFCFRSHNSNTQSSSKSRP